MSPYWQEQMDHAPTRVYAETLAAILKDIGVTPMYRVLEIGTGWGISGSVFMDAGVGELVTIDPGLKNPPGLASLQEIMRHNPGERTVVPLTGYSKDVLPELIRRREKFDLAYIDGFHGYETVRDDLRLASELVATGGHIILDDYLHPYNFNPDKRGDIYGVARAAHEFLLERKLRSVVHPTLNEGFLVIPV